MLFKEFLFKKENTITFVARIETHQLLIPVFEVLTCYEWPNIPCYLPDDPTMYSYNREAKQIMKLDIEYESLEKEYYAFAFRRKSSLWHLSEADTQLFKKCLFTVHSFLDTVPYLVVTKDQRTLIHDTVNFFGGAEEPV